MQTYHQWLVERERKKKDHLNLSESEPKSNRYKKCGGMERKSRRQTGNDGTWSPLPIMRLTALFPPPPTPTTLILADSTTLNGDGDKEEEEQEQMIPQSRLLLGLRTPPLLVRFLESRPMRKRRAEKRTKAEGEEEEGIIVIRCWLGLGFITWRQPIISLSRSSSPSLSMGSFYCEGLGLGFTSLGTAVRLRGQQAVPHMGEFQLRKSTLYLYLVYPQMFFFINEMV